MKIKIGMRKPSLKRSIKARTTGKMKRKMKKAINPMYGKKGIGIINNPKKSVYNKVYNKTTIAVGDVANTATTGKFKKNNFSIWQFILNLFK